MLEQLRKLPLNTPFPLLKVHERLVATGSFDGDLAALIVLLYTNPNFVLSMPHGYSPETFTVKRIKDYE